MLVVIVMLDEAGEEGVDVSLEFKCMLGFLALHFQYKSMQQTVAKTKVMNPKIKIIICSICLVSDEFVVWPVVISPAALRKANAARCGVVLHVKSK